MQAWVDLKRAWRRVGFARFHDPDEEALHAVPERALGSAPALPAGCVRIDAALGEVPRLRFSAGRCGSARSRAPLCLRLVLEVVATSPAHAAAVTPRGRLGGSWGAKHAAPELTLSYALKPTPRRPLESRYGFVTEQPRMVQRA